MSVGSFDFPPSQAFNPYGTYYVVGAQSNTIDEDAATYTTYTCTGESANYPVSADTSADIMLTEPVGTIGIRLEGDKVYELNYQRP